MSDREAGSLFGDARLHIVTGKGGTGKTTVAAALALALARRGNRVLLAEVEDRQGISQVFDIPPLSDDETQVLSSPSGGEVIGLAVDAKAALLEYLQLYYKAGRAGGLLEKFGAIDFATTIAPGVRDVLLIGKVYEAVGRRAGGRGGARGRTGPHVFDAVILDAPPTGRVVRFLNVNHEVADVARVGPIRHHADAITRMLHDPATVVHVVTLLEEMPVQESVDVLVELRAARFAIGAVIVNQTRGSLVDPGVLAAVDGSAEQVDAVRADLRSVGVRASRATAAGLIQEGLDHRDRLALEAQTESQLTGVDAPVIHLPILTAGVEGGGIRLLADSLVEQGMA